MDYTVYIVDAVLVLMFILTIVHSARIGFARALAGIVAWIAASIIALNFCAPLAERVYVYFFQDRIIQSIEENVGNLHEDAEVLTVTTAVLADLPEVVVRAAKSVGVDTQVIAERSKDVEVIEQNVAITLEREIFAPICIAALRVVMFLLILIVIVALGRWLFSYVGKGIEKIHGIDKINRALGGILGILKAAALVSVLAILAKLVAEFTGGSFEEMVNQSKLVAFIQESPFSNGFFE